MTCVASARSSTQTEGQRPTKLQETESGMHHAVRSKETRERKFEIESRGLAVLGAGGGLACEGYRFEL
jgi:hypothetical protein